MNTHLHLELEKQDKLRIRMEGDPVIFCKMIRTAMEARQDIAAAFIAAVVHYSQHEGFDCGDLSKMVILGR